MAYFMKEFNFNTRGIYFDLLPTYQELNIRFLADQIRAHLRWGAATSIPINGFTFLARPAEVATYTIT